MNKILAAALMSTFLASTSLAGPGPKTEPAPPAVPGLGEVAKSTAPSAAALLSQKRVKALIDLNVPPFVYIQDASKLTGDQAVVELYTLTPPPEGPGPSSIDEMLRSIMGAGPAAAGKDNPTKVGTALLETLEKMPDGEIVKISKLKFWMLLQALKEYASRKDDPRYLANPELLDLYKKRVEDVLARKLPGDTELAGLGRSSHLREVLAERRKTLGLALQKLEASPNPPADKVAFLKKVQGELATFELDAEGKPLVPSTLVSIVRAIPEKELAQNQWRTLFECYPMGKSLWENRVDKLWRQNIDGGGVTVAILDTGIDKDHPYMNGHVADGTNFTAHRYIEHRKDKAGNDVFGTPDNRGNHGTHVASTVLAYAPEAQIINLKVLDEEFKDQIPPELVHDDMMTVAAIKNGLASVWEHNEAVASGKKPGRKIDIVSMSLGIPGSNSATFDPANPDELSKWVKRLSDQGVIVVVAAGNEGSKEMRRPAVTPEAITVGAADYFGRVTSFSSDQTILNPAKGGIMNKPDVWAFGDDIHAARFDAKSDYSSPDKLATTMSGTSMATPHVAGVTALLVQEGRRLGLELTPAQVKMILTESASPLANGNSYARSEGGMVDPVKAVAYLRENAAAFKGRAVADTGKKPTTGK